MQTIMTKEVGPLIYVDDGDFDFLSRFEWFGTDGYPATYLNGIRTPMSNIIMGVPLGKKVWDHKDRNPFNNQRSNFRLANYSQNGANRKISKNNRCGYIGVIEIFTGRNRWRASVMKDGKNYTSHHFTAEQAARARDRRAIALHGEFANTNFPREDYK